MSDGKERGEKEHVINEDESWEETLKHLVDDGVDAKGRSEREDEAPDSGSAEECEGEGAPGYDDERQEKEEESIEREREEMLEQDMVKQKESSGEETVPPETEQDRAGHTKRDRAAAQKRIKKSRKELLDILEQLEGELEKTREELGNIKQEFAIKEDKLLRMVAEFENYRKRTRREWELHQKRANADLIKDILGILDDFERAFEASDDSGEHFRSGVKLIYSGLLDVMGRAGLAEVEAENRLFDPQYHEAMGEMESDEVEAGFVAKVVQKGYMLRDQLLRPAKVIVAKVK